MRNLKRFLALALTMLMVIGSFSLSAKSFADTAEMTADQINALDLLSDLSIFIGKEDGTFGGAEEINRKEMAILASRVQTGEKFGQSYGENVTPFADVVTDFEAILYAHNMGIVIGFEDGTFRPDDKVIYQDVLTMIVRTLGYKGAEMDAGYPSTYINKARELGITKGITSTVIPSWTSTVARQDVATLLYNALFAVKADGTTAAKFFGIDTYVLTAMKNYNMTNVTCYDANGTRVVVQPLNADGSINDMYYHLPVSAFEEAGVEIIPGASYRIASTDNLETVKAISMCPSIELSHDSDENTVELTWDGNVNLPGVDGKRVNYKAVNRYTTVYNNQGTHKAENEIIVYNQRGFNFTVSSDGSIWLEGFDFYKENGDKVYNLVTDAAGNLLDANGYIVAYYMPELVEYTYTVFNNVSNKIPTVYSPYFVYDDATDTYTPATKADLERAVDGKPQDNSTVYHVWTGDQWCAEHNQFEAGTAHANADKSSFVVTNKDDMYSAVAYDDDFDGSYDRLFFMYHSFGIGDANNTINPHSNFTAGNGTNYGGVVNPYFADSPVAEGEPVRFYADAARKQTTGTYKQMSNLTSLTATIVEKYELTTISGLVTAVNGTKMTIGGNLYDIATLALHNFKEAIPYGKDAAYKYIGQNVTAYLFDGKIFEIKGYENTWVIFEDYTGLTTNGFATALAFSGSAELKNITIASVDGYFFLKNNYNIPTNTDAANANIGSAIFGKLQTGSFYEATKDVYGYYHINTTGVTNNWSSNGWTKYVDGAAWGAEKDFWFANNRSNTFSWFTGTNSNPAGNYLGDGNANYIWNPTNAPTDWIFFDPTTKTFQAGKGFPTNGSYIAATAVNTNCHFWGTVDMHDCLYIAGNVAYFSNAKFYGAFGNGASVSTESALKTDLVWVSANDLPYSVDNNVPGMSGAGETLYGYRYIYSNGIYSLSTGKETTVSTDGIYNYRLERGVYAVTNGVIDRKITRFDDSNNLWACATLFGGTNSSVALGNKYNGFGLESKANYTDGSQDDAEIRIFENKSYTIYMWNGDGGMGSVFATNADGSFAKWNSVEDMFGGGNAVRVFYVKGSEYTENPVFISIGRTDGVDLFGTFRNLGGN